MDPILPKKPRNPNDLLIIKNIDTEDHEWYYDTINTPLPYFLRAGEVRKIPFYIARHGVEKLIDKILLRQGKIHTSLIFRNELRKQIVLGLEHINLVREKTPNEIALEEMQRKKDVDPYEELLKEREVEAEKQQIAQQPAPTQPLVQTQGAVPETAAPVIQSSTPNATQPAANPSQPLQTPFNGIDAPNVDPERAKVYSTLATTLHLDLSHLPTKEKFDATPLDQLKAEFADQIPEWANGTQQPAPTVHMQTGIPPVNPTLQPTQVKRVEGPLSDTLAASGV